MKKEKIDWQAFCSGLSWWKYQDTELESQALVIKTSQSKKITWKWKSGSEFLRSRIKMIELQFYWNCVVRGSLM